MDVETEVAFWDEPHRRQMVWFCVTIIPAFVIFIMDGGFFYRMAFPAYILSLLLLLVVMFFGTEINGARSWFRFGPIALQPSEFAKITTSLALASFCASAEDNLPTKKLLFNTGAILGIPFLLVLLQGDFGSALVFLPSALHCLEKISRFPFFS